MDLVNSFMLMEIFMRVNGKTIKPMEMVAILMQMELLITESGKMISNMEKELKHGQMEQNMRVNTLKVKSITVEL